MVLAVVLLGAGAIYIIAGYKGASITDVITGNIPDKSTGPSSSSDPSSAAASAAASNAREGLGLFDGHLVADWIIDVLKWARNTGQGGVKWKGQITDGYRTFAQQVMVHSTFGPKADPGTSNHEKVKYPGGAVDVSDYQTLATLVPHYPGPGPTLVSGSIIGDPLHFSSNGH